MRQILFAAAAGLVLWVAPAYAQDGSTSQPPAATQQKASPQTTIKSLSIVDIGELPQDAQQKVNEVASQASPADLKKLRGSLEKSPEIKKALSDKGLDSSHVIAANLSAEGALTLVTKKTT